MEVEISKRAEASEANGLPGVRKWPEIKTYKT